GIPTDVHLSNGKSAERPFVSVILSPGETAVMDRGYQSHKDFDLLQAEGKHFVCRIKAGTTKTLIEQNDVDPNSALISGLQMELLEKMNLAKSRLQASKNFLNFNYPPPEAVGLTQ
ncbi:MAG: transposase, partial [Desulfamplus sp.]|nr:transposase [Desulfamplus sp.]